MVRKVIIWAVAINLVFQCTAFARSSLEVTGIVYSDRQQAIVDGVLVEEGDEINGVIVEEIGEDFVKFKDGDEIITRHVGEKTLKIKAKNKFEEFKEKIIRMFNIKKKPSVTWEETEKVDKTKILEKAPGDYMQAQEELIKVQDRDKRARKAIKDKIKAARGTGLERDIDPDAWEKD